MTPFLRFVGRVLILVLLVLLPAGAAVVAYGINNGDPLLDDVQDLLERILDLVGLGRSARPIDRD